MVNIPAITGSFCRISSASVKLIYPERLTDTFFLIIVLLTRRELVEIMTTGDHEFEEIVEEYEVPVSHSGQVNFTEAEEIP